MGKFTVKGQQGLDRAICSHLLQLMLLAGNISITLAIQDGFGKHSWDIPFKNYPSMLFVSAFAGTFMIIGAAWSKTAFAVTLLRISTGWQKSFIWFIIVSVNAVLGTSAVMTWARCWPVEKLWMMNLAGECWPYKFNVRYNIFTAGKYCKPFSYL